MQAQVSRVPDVIAFLARRRVALGLVVAVAAVALARPTWESWWVGLAVAAPARR